MDFQEDHPSQLFIQHENNISDSFPSLNSVYKKEIFGTPVPFEYTMGNDEPYIKIKANSITFMKEYESKSFEELRYEDYQSNRTLGIEWFQEKNYLKCLSPELWKPLPTSTTTVAVKVSRSCDSLTARVGENKKNVSDLNATNSLSKLNSIDDDVSAKLFRELRPTKERSSFLTNVDKQNIIKPDIQLPLNFKEVPPATPGTRYTTYQYHNRATCQTDDINDVGVDNATLPRSVMTAQNLERYFQHYNFEASFPPDFFNAMPHNFRVTCEDPRLAYNYYTVKAKQARTTTHMETLLELLQYNKHGHCWYSNYDAIPSKGSIYARLQDAWLRQQQLSLYQKGIEPKYKIANDHQHVGFNMGYFWANIDPCSRTTAQIGKKFQQLRRRSRKESRNVSRSRPRQKRCHGQDRHNFVTGTEVFCSQLL